MTAAVSTTSNSASNSADPATAGLLAELTSTGATIRGLSWALGGLGAGSGELGQLAAASSPLSALSSAGFDDVRRLVSFLDQPLNQLAGDPGSISSAAQDFQATGNTLATLADSYRTSSVAQTSTWSG